MGKLNLKELYYFAGQCLALDEHPEFRNNIIEWFSAGAIDLDEFISLCDENFVLPAVYLKFKSHRLLELFPKQYVELFENVYSLNKNRNTRILEQIDEINAKLKEEQIRPVYLKGTAHLLDGVYSDIGERMIGDIDFLVKEEEYERTANVLQQLLGYKKQNDSPNDGLSPIHYPPLFKDDSPTVVEIHHTPVYFRFAKQFSTKLIFKHIKTVKNCFVPSDEHKVIHNFIHSQLSHMGYVYKKNSLRDMYDLYLLAKRIDPNEVIDQIERKNELIDYLYYTSKVFKTKDRSVVLTRGKVNIYSLLCDVFLEYRHLSRFYRLSIKDYRKYVFKRISSIVWYNRHVKGLMKYFRNT